MLKSGLIGRNIGASRSPWLHQQEARAQGILLSYELFDFTAASFQDGCLPELIADLQAKRYAGVNITYPFKQMVIPLLDELADSARQVGAVNTIAIRDGRLVGHNTDMRGFRNSFARGLPGARLDHVLQLGAGGAGSAVATALLSCGVGRLDIIDIDEGRATSLADFLVERFGAGRAVARSAGDDATESVDGLVNATPIGMAQHPTLPIAAERVQAHHWVADIVYFPVETELLRVANNRGCRTLNGVGMVVNQAALAFEIFTGRPADVDRMLTNFSS